MKGELLCVVASTKGFEDLVLIEVRVLLALLNLHFNYYEHSKFMITIYL